LQRKFLLAEPAADRRVMAPNELADLAERVAMSTVRRVDGVRRVGEDLREGAPNRLDLLALDLGEWRIDAVTITEEGCGPQPLAVDVHGVTDRAFNESAVPRPGLATRRAELSEDPVGREELGPLCEARGRPIAAPAVVARVVAEPRANRVEHDVARRCN
jgi:hypothetical protein